MNVAESTSVVAVGLGLLVLLWRLLRRRKPKPWIEQAACSSCGWQGETSRYAGRCPRCNSPVGEQRARRGQ